MTCKNFAQQLAGLIHSDSKPLKNLCTIAAGEGHLNILIWARENGCAWGPETCAEAALKGQADILKWLREYCQYSRPIEINYADAISRKRKLGDFDSTVSVKKAKFDICPWDATTCYNAISGGHLDIFIWAKERDCLRSVYYINHEGKTQVVQNTFLRDACAIAALKWTFAYT